VESDQLAARNTLKKKKGKGGSGRGKRKRESNKKRKKVCSAAGTRIVGSTLAFPKKKTEVSSLRASRGRTKGKRAEKNPSGMKNQHINCPRLTIVRLLPPGEECVYCDGSFT